jgi:FAD/FMN-containing dehydrogenase
VPSDRGTVVKLAVLPTDVGEMAALAESEALGHRLQYAAIGRAALGIILMRLEGDPSRQATVIAELRREAALRGGSVVLQSAPHDIRARVGTWGPAGNNTGPIMRAVKARFDPRGLLNHGREPWESGPP